jgi:hypothetical protein
VAHDDDYNWILKLVVPSFFSFKYSCLLVSGRLQWIFEIRLAANSRGGNLIVHPFQVLHKGGGNLIVHPFQFLHKVRCFGYWWGLGIWFGAEQWIVCRSITSHRRRNIRYRWSCLVSISWIFFCCNLFIALRTIPCPQVTTAMVWCKGAVLQHYYAHVV